MATNGAQNPGFNRSLNPNAVEFHPIYYYNYPHYLNFPPYLAAYCPNLLLYFNNLYYFQINGPYSPSHSTPIRRTPAPVIGEVVEEASASSSSRRRRTSATARDDDHNYNQRLRFTESSEGSHFRRRERELGFMGKDHHHHHDVKPDGTETTAMIRNIPNQYTRGMLMEFLDDFCQKENQKIQESAKEARGSTSSNPPPLIIAYDFLYLPVDFKNRANKGYAFVNFTNPIGVWRLRLATDNQRWKHCRSPKMCKIAYATIQVRISYGTKTTRSLYHSEASLCDIHERVHDSSN